MAEFDGDPAAEIADIQHTMRTDYRTYHNDPRMQDRYLSAITARDSAVPEPAAAPSEADKEIATIQERIKTDSRGYDGDKEMQARYLELITERDAEAAPSPGAPAQAPGEAGTHATARPAAEVVAELKASGKPELATLMAGYGDGAREAVEYMGYYETQVMNTVSAEGAQILSNAFDEMSAADQANMYAHFADAGRAIRNR